MDDGTDLRNFRPRLVKLGIAAAIGATLTFLSMRAMTSSGRGPNLDPVGSSSVALLGLAIFVVTTGVAHAIIARRR